MYPFSHLPSPASFLWSWKGCCFIRLVRFRRRRATTPGEPPQVYGSQPIEIAWTVGTAADRVRSGAGHRPHLWEVNVDAPSPKPGDNTLFVTVVGRQWWWEYTYDYYDGRKLGFITANELHVPARETARRATRLFDARIGRRLSQLLGAATGGQDRSDSGTHQPHVVSDRRSRVCIVGQCAEFCGTQHANMLLRVVVDPPDEFDKWLAHKKEDAAKDARRCFAAGGEKVFLEQSCINCHRVRGTSRHKGTYAPGPDASDEP